MAADHISWPQQNHQSTAIPWPIPVRWHRRVGGCVTLAALGMLRSDRSWAGGQLPCSANSSASSLAASLRSCNAGGGAGMYLLSPSANTH